MRRGNSLSKGFTIVELLIVIVVIGILAVIVIVAFNGVQNRAYDTAVRADLSNASKKLGLFYADNGRYVSTTAELDSAGIRMTKSSYAVSPQVTVNLAYCSKSSSRGYIIVAMSKSGKRFVVTESGQVTEDISSVAWTESLANLTPICTDPVYGYQGAMIHGYYVGDAGGAPWRIWTGS